MTTDRVIIVGAGPVGLTAALALKSAGLSPVLFDARARGAGHDDPRAVALSHGSRLCLERLGAWSGLPATPIREIEVSQEGGFGRAHIDARDHGIGALGHVVRLGSLTRSLEARAAARGIEIVFECAAGDAAAAPPGVSVAIGAARADGALLVRAEGRPAAPASVKDYGQSAVVTEARPRDPGEARAWERFTREGPLALLPLEDGFSVVWCMRPERADAAQRMDDDEFVAALARATRFAPYRWSAVAARHIYRLTLSRGAQPALSREVALGNAAQTLHPVAGQGLNLGLRDAFELALALRGGISDDALRRWRRSRRADRDAVVGATDAYVTLFSNDIAPLRAARGLGLALVDTVPFVRGLVARRMMFGAR